MEHGVCEKIVYAVLSKHDRVQICIYWMVTIMLTRGREKYSQKKKKWLCDEIMVDFLFSLQYFLFLLKYGDNSFPLR